MDTSTTQVETITTTLEESNQTQGTLAEEIRIKQEIDDDDVILIEDDNEPPKNLEERISIAPENVEIANPVTNALEEVKVIWHQKKYKYLDVGPKYFNTIVIYAKKYQNHFIACYRGHEYIRYNDKELQTKDQWFCNKSLDCPAMLSLAEGKGTNKICIVDNHTCWHPVDYSCPGVDHLNSHSLDILNVVYHSNLSRQILCSEGFQKFAEGIVILDEILDPATAYLNGCSYIRAAPFHQLENTNLSSFYTFNCFKTNCHVDLYISMKGSYKKMVITVEEHTCSMGRRIITTSSQIDQCPTGYVAVTPLGFRNRQDLELFEKVEYFVKKKPQYLTWPFIYIHVSKKSIIYQEHIYPLISHSHNGYICHYNIPPKCSALLKVKRGGRHLVFVSLVYNHSCPHERPDSLNTSCLSYTICKIQPDPNFKREIKSLSDSINNNITDAPDLIFKEEYTSLTKLKYCAVRYTLDLNSSPNEINKNYVKAELLESKFNVPHVIVCTDLTNNRRMELYKRHAYVVDYTAPITDLRICKDSVTCMAALAWKTNASMLVIIGEHTCIRKESYIQRQAPLPDPSTLSSSSIKKRSPKTNKDNVNDKRDRSAKKRNEKKNDLSKKRVGEKKQSKKSQDICSEVTNYSSVPLKSITSVPIQTNNTIINETNKIENFTLRRLDAGDKPIQEIISDILPANGNKNSSRPSAFSYKGYQYHLKYGLNEYSQCFRSPNCTGKLRIYDENGFKKVEEGTHTCDNFGYKNITIMISTCKEFNQVPSFNPADPVFVTMLVNVGNNHNILYYRGFTYIDDRSLSCDRGEFSMTLMSCNMIYMCAKSNVCSAGLSINLLESKAMEIGIHTCTINNNLTEKVKLFREFQKVSFQKVFSLNDDIIYTLGEEQLVVKIYEQEDTTTYLFKGQKYRESISGCSFSSDAGCKTLYLCDQKKCTAGLLIDSAKSVLEVGLHSCREDQLEEEKKKIILRNDIEISINQMLQRLANFIGQQSPEIIQVEHHCNDTLKWLDSNPYALREELEETRVRLISTFNAFHLSTPTFLSMVDTTLVNVTPAVFVNNSEAPTVIIPSKMSDELGFPEHCLIQSQSDAINTISAPIHLATLSGPGSSTDKNKILPEIPNRAIKRKFNHITKTDCNEPPEKTSTYREAELNENTSFIKAGENSLILKRMLGHRTKNIIAASNSDPCIEEHRHVVVTGYKGFIKAILHENKIYVNKKKHKFSSKWDCRYEECNATFFLNIKDEIFLKSGEHTCPRQCNLVEVEVLEKFKEKIGGISEELWSPDLIPVFNERGELCVIYKGFVYGNCMNSQHMSTSWTCIRPPCTSLLLLRDGKDSLVLEHTCLQNLPEQIISYEVYKGSKNFFHLGQFIYTARRRHTASKSSKPNYIMSEEDIYLECIYFETLGCRGNAIFENGPCDLLREHTCKLLTGKSTQHELSTSISAAIKEEPNDIFVEEMLSNLGEISTASETNGLSNLVISNVVSLSDTDSILASKCKQQCSEEYDSEETLSCDDTSADPDNEVRIKSEVEDFQPNYESKSSEVENETTECMGNVPVLTHIVPNIPKLKLPQEDIMDESSTEAVDTFVYEDPLVITSKSLEQNEVDDFEVAIPVTYLITKDYTLEEKNVL